jgi:hypothetical protein
MSGQPATPAVDLRVLHRHRDVVVTTHIPALSCRRRVLGE